MSQLKEARKMHRFVNGYIFGNFILFRPLKIGRNFVFGYFSFFCFLFSTQNQVRNNHRTGMSDILY